MLQSVEIYENPHHSNSTSPSCYKNSLRRQTSLTSSANWMSVSTQRCAVVPLTPCFHLALYPLVCGLLANKFLSWLHENTSWVFALLSGPGMGDLMTLRSSISVLSHWLINLPITINDNNERHFSANIPVCAGRLYSSFSSTSFHDIITKRSAMRAAAVHAL